MTTRMSLLAAAALALAAAAPALARDDAGATPRPAGDAAAAGMTWKSPAEIIELLAADGYRVHEIETDDGVYEVEARTRGGVEVDLDIDPRTGKITFRDDD
ncbi:MAG: PepSY domain-containing protein [Hyphomicrobiaceae bacterium]|nr:PepSY domain-containing protein [Hyphomicrobiaceae bacterium]